MTQNLVSPRPLTADEMWLGYDAPFPHYLRRGFDERIPLDAFSTNSQYPLRRLTYDRFPAWVVAEKHALRLFKINARDQVWNFVEMGPEMESLAHEQLDLQRFQVPAMQDLADLCAFDGMRQDENRQFREGDYMTALWKHATNWSMFLPYHVEALPRTHHHLRAKLGKAYVSYIPHYTEAAPFNNVSACLVKVAEDFKGLGQHDFARLLLDLRFKAAWMALDMREYAKVRTVYSSAKRSLALIRQIMADHPDQVRMLEDVGKDPAFEDYWGLGPLQWSTTHGLGQVVKYPDIEAPRARNKARPLRDNERRAIWSEPVPRASALVDHISDMFRALKSC
ncbi:hypothetical protein L198_06914 [Cryptococcus wingfieldii CBS 7118]|uniref:Uncharacterized protein n=1 Tax=Cryptococcus wingfieldii CBS 7118 TaxID=1295528 RepID=A0A1E3IGG7_9TREE|nr:hypothetical protein L198_06914 [Cryptococcus wingfieldii CBS 7118]ODN87690.1 hypothetical protein L198_06914 [Cryptococcus wingfieldii CBS 7118]